MLSPLSVRYLTVSITAIITDYQSCVTVEVDVLGSLSLIVLTVSVDVKKTLKKKKQRCARASVCSSPDLSDL